MSRFIHVYCNDEEVAEFDRAAIEQAVDFIKHHQERGCKGPHILQLITGDTFSFGHLLDGTFTVRFADA